MGISSHQYFFYIIKRRAQTIRQECACYHNINSLSSTQLWTRSTYTSHRYIVFYYSIIIHVANKAFLFSSRQMHACLSSLLIIYTLIIHMQYIYTCSMCNGSVAISSRGDALFVLHDAFWILRKFSCGGSSGSGGRRRRPLRTGSPGSSNPSWGLSSRTCPAASSLLSPLPRPFSPSPLKQRRLEHSPPSRRRRSSAGYACANVKCTHVMYTQHARY